MASNTLPRDYDIARILADYLRRIKDLELAALRDPVSASIWQGVPGGFDTGWQPITNVHSDWTPQAGVNAPMVRRWGPTVYVKGRANTAVAAPGGTVYTLPTGFGFEPSGSIHEAGRSLIAGSGNSAHRYFVTTGGVGSQQGVAALGLPLNSLVTLPAMWMVELP
jgi:hypothetical protein